MIELERFGEVTRVHMSSRRSRLVGYSVSAYLVRGVLIDAGFPTVAGELARFLDEVKPRGVVVTHQHEDHAGNIELVARRGIPIAAAEPTLAAARVGEPGVGFYRHFVWDRMPKLASAVTAFEPEGLALVATPGHSPDHHVVWDAERETLYAGDLFLGVKVRVARPFENPRELAASVRRAAALRPRLMFDAHRGLVPEPAAALAAKADWIDETVARIDRRIDDGWSDRAIGRAILGREDVISIFSAGDLSRLNFVKAVRAGRGTI